MRKNKARAYAYRHKTDRGRSARRRLSSYGGVIVAVLFIVAAFIVAVVTGGLLGDKAAASAAERDKQTTSPSDTLPAAAVAHDYTDARASVKSEFLDISALSNETLSALVPVSTELTVVIRDGADNDGKINYASSVAAQFADCIMPGLSVTANSALTPDVLFDTLKAKGVYVTVCITLLSQKAVSAQAREAAWAFERALALEADSFGADEILLLGLDFKDTDNGAESVFGLLSGLHTELKTAKLGVAVGADNFASVDRTVLLYNLTAVSDFAAVDFDGANAVGDIAAFFVENEYFFTRYKLRILPDNTDSELRDSQTSAAEATGIGWHKRVKIYNVVG